MNNRLTWSIYWSWCIFRNGRMLLETFCLNPVSHNAALVHTYSTYSILQCCFFEVAMFVTMDELPNYSVEYLSCKLATPWCRYSVATNYSAYSCLILYLIGILMCTLFTTCQIYKELIKWIEVILPQAYSLL